MKKNVLFNFLLTGSNIIFPLITFPYLARVLGPAGIGSASFIQSFCQVFIVIGALGIPLYGVREIAKNSGQLQTRSSLFLSLLLIHILVISILIALYFIFAQFVEQFNAFPLIVFLGGIHIFLSVFNVEWLFTGMGDFRFIAIRSIIIKVTGVIAILFFVKRIADVDTYIFIIVFQSLLTSILNFYFSRKHVQINLKRNHIVINRHIRPVLLLGFYVILTGVYTLLPTTLLGLMADKKSVGQFVTADKLIQLVISLFSSISIVIVSRLNSSRRQEDYEAVLKKSLYLVILFAVPISFMLFLLAKPIMLLVAGNNYGPAILCLRIMSPNVLTVALAQVFCIQVLSVQRQDRSMVFLAILGMVVSLLLNVLFIPKYAHIASAWAVFFAECLVTIFAYLFARKHSSITFPFKLILVNLLLCLPFILVCYVLLHLGLPNSVQLIFSMFVCFVVYFISHIYFVKDEYVSQLLVSIVPERFKLLVTF